MNEVKIELLSFDNDIAEFEISVGRKELVTCTKRIAVNTLHDFVNGEFVINPDHWYDINEDEISQPDWFKRKNLFELNNVFENNFQKFM